MTEEFDRILGQAPGGESVGVIDLGSDQLRVGITNYGARMLSIEAPDRAGQFDHVLLGFDRLDMVLKAGSCGGVLGRVANRIAGARFTLDGTTYPLSQNDGPNTLHGGKTAFAKRFWTLVERSSVHVVFALESPDGDQGFPGAVSARATYRVSGDTLDLFLEATTTKPTPLNMSAHPYFNLAGANALDVCDQTIQVAASHFLPTDAYQIPTGVIHAVAGTPFDFRDPVVIGSRIRSDDPQLLFARGFDHHLIFDKTGLDAGPTVTMAHPASGRCLDIATTHLGVQVYTGNSLNGALVGHGGAYRQTAGVAFEPQAYPDAPNQPGFPSTIVQPGQAYAERIVYRFRTED